VSQVRLGSPLAALRLLTRLPVPGAAGDGPAAVAGAVPYFPLVGLLLGAILAGCDAILRRWLEPAVVSALLLLLLALLTGGFHLDGLVDSADGLLAYTDPGRRLEIMRDSHVGAFGVAACALILLLQYTALAALPAGQRPTALLLMGLTSRWSIVLLAALFPYARPTGTGKAVREGATPGRAVPATVGTAGLAGLLGGLGGIALLLWVAIVTLALGRVAVGRLGGLTGDVYGAGVVLSEAAALVAAPLALGATPWWQP